MFRYHKMMYHRKSPRAKRYDYSGSGMYFVTICCKDMEHCFGEIEKGVMRLNELGNICDQEIERMGWLRQRIEIHEYVIIPNHIHLLLAIVGTGLFLSWNKTTHNNDGASVKWEDNNNVVPTDPYIKYPNQSLWSIVWWLKSAISRECRKRGLPFARQPRYHDHILKDPKEYDTIIRYIQNNPANRCDE